MWEPALGKGRECPECSAQGWHIPPVLEAGDSDTPAPAHDRDSRNSSCTPNAGREKVEEARLGDPQKTILKIFKNP